MLHFCIPFFLFFFTSFPLFFPLQEMKLSKPVPFYGRYINNIILTSAGGILIPPSSSTNDSLMMPSFIAPFLTSMPPSGKFSMFDIHITRLMGSTDQADPSCFYFKISWILMERRWFYFFNPLHDSSSAVNGGDKK